MGTKRPLQSREFLNLRPHMAGSNDMTHQPVYWLNAEPPPAEVEQPLFRFAAPHSVEPLVLELLLQVEESGGALPELELKTDDSGCRLTVAVAESSSTGPENVVASIHVPPASLPFADDELQFEIGGSPGSSVPGCRVVLRRTTCRISTALIERQRESLPVRPGSLAALYWYGWRRYSEVVGLRRFTSGKSGSDVLVFRPRLRDPEEPILTHGVLPGVVSECWGSCLLVKTGSRKSVLEEWTRYQTFLRDRLHPFMSRSEELVTVRPIGIAAREETGATVIGSFLGGDLLQAESFEQLVAGGSSAGRCNDVLDRLFSILGTWYSGHSVRPLGDWSKVFDRTDESAPMQLFGSFDFHQDSDRRRYGAALAWDIPFIEHRHLRQHLLGRSGADAAPGLLPELMTWPVRFSLAHGDLHTRNILADDDNVWVLDFGQAGIQPTLFDFAKLEVYLRLWCLSLDPLATSVPDAARRFENLLLDHMTGSESSLEPVLKLSRDMGAEPQQLQRIASCICHIRRHAQPYGLECPDRRDYLAVLYLTVLNTLQFAGSDRELVQNFRLLVSLAWVLEDVLSRMAGLKPHDRRRLAADPRRLVTPLWLSGDSAPARVEYLMRSGDDSRALAPLAATRGVLQNDHHHLDVFDHTLLVLGGVERLLSDPLDALLNPAALDEQIRQDLRQQGLSRLTEAPRLPEGERPDTAVIEPLLDDLRGLLATSRTDEARDILKWSALLHDVGKPATRRINLGGGGRINVQFLGHELYGLQIVASHLRQLFPDDGDSGNSRRAGIEYLILRHHDHHNLVNRYAGDDKRLNALRAAVTTGELPPRELKYLAGFLDPENAEHAELFPLLILHGFADTLACRGPASNRSLCLVAEIDLLLLAVAVRFPAMLQKEESASRFAELTAGFCPELGVQGAAAGRLLEHLRAWYLRQMESHTASTSTSRSDGPDRDALLSEAGRFLQSLEAR